MEKVKNNQKINPLLKIFKSRPTIKLVYLFGSQSSGKAGPLSDYDFAIYLDEKNKKKIFNLKCELMDKIGRQLKTEKVDIVILDTAESPELKYNIVKEGKLIFEREPYKILVEPRIFSDYFDFRYLLLKYNLTQA